MFTGCCGCCRRLALRDKRRGICWWPPRSCCCSLLLLPPAPENRAGVHMGWWGGRRDGRTPLPSAQNWPGRQAGCNQDDSSAKLLSWPLETLPVGRKRARGSLAASVHHPCAPVNTPAHQVTHGHACMLWGTRAVPGPGSWCAGWSRSCWRSCRAAAHPACPGCACRSTQCPQRGCGGAGRCWGS